MSHGSCACRAIKYSFEGEPLQQVCPLYLSGLMTSANLLLMTNKSICHCLPCRKITGSVFTTNLSIPLPSLHFLQGKENLKSFSLKHPAGMKFTYYFCENCGTKIYKEGDGKGLVGVAIVQAGTCMSSFSVHLRLWFENGVKLTNFVVDHTDGEEGLGIEDVKIGAELWVKNRVGWLERERERCCAIWRISMKVGPCTGRLIR